MAWTRRLYLAAAGLTLILFSVWECRGEEKGFEPNADNVVARVLEAYGGARAINKVNSVTAKGRITEFLSGKTGTYARFFQRPGKLRIEVTPEQGGEVRILNKDHAWQLGSDGAAPVSELELQSMLYQYSSLNLPMGLANGNYHVTYGGKERRNGQVAYLLLVDPKKAPRMVLVVDAKTSRIVRVDASFAMGVTGSGELSTEYSDFQAVEGVQFPHKLTSFAGGIKLSEVDLDEIEVNRKIPQELFSPELEE